MRLIAAMPLLIIIIGMVAIMAEHYIGQRKWLTRAKAKRIVD
jgi:hypothetical protein